MLRNELIDGLKQQRGKTAFLQRVSTACYAERCISYDRFRPSVRLSVTVRYQVV